MSMKLLHLNTPNSDEKKILNHLIIRIPRRQLMHQILERFKSSWLYCVRSGNQFWQKLLVPCHIQVNINKYASTSTDLHLQTGLYFLLSATSISVKGNRNKFRLIYPINLKQSLIDRFKSKHNLWTIAIQNVTRFFFFSVCTAHEDKLTFLIRKCSRSVYTTLNFTIRWKSELNSIQTSLILYRNRVVT